jgi:drug/metabolite transporter (DMT)-like permease
VVFSWSVDVNHPTSRPRVPGPAPAAPRRRLRRESLGFALGSACFALGALPGYVGLVGATADNVTYFVGSLLFTGAAFIQLRLSGRWRPGAWRSREAWDDWWSAAIQFVGTLFFNVTTGVALFSHLSADQARHHVWRPDALGSVCFLVASALGVLATTHRERLWDPEARTWWAAWAGMAGSLAFAVAAVASFVVPSSGDVRNAENVNLGTFVGALCFLAAALLTRPPRD